ncbi:MAG: hypothetical protein FWD32_01080, partial [Firmicutes bacterium]|nr:hypothetical protein [Bacillota bacterium]
MKYLDTVKITTDRYKDLGYGKGYVCTIIEPNIMRTGEFLVAFPDPIDFGDEILGVPVGELEFVKCNGITDKEILNSLPYMTTSVWCKVEDGFILNLKGEK